MQVSCSATPEGNVYLFYRTSSDFARAMKPVVPFLLAGIAIGPFLTFFAGFRRYLGAVEKVMGVLLILTGVLFLTGQFSRISYWFLETFPILQSFG